MKAIRQVEVDCMAFDPDRWRDLRDFVGSSFHSYEPNGARERFLVWTQKGESRSVLTAFPGDWIVKEQDTDGNGQPFDLYTVVTAVEFSKNFRPKVAPAPAPVVPPKV